MSATWAPPQPARVETLRRRIRWIVVATISYNVLEAVVAIGAGTVASSSALVGFGLDSVIEVLSAVAVAWQFAGSDPQAREKTALRLIAFSFFALAAYVAVDSILALTGGKAPEHSPVGIGLTIASLIAMPLLSWAERRTGTELGSASAVSDSKQTLTCAWLSAAVLAGLLLNALLGWAWADPVAGLLIAVLAVREGTEAWNGETCTTPLSQLTTPATTSPAPAHTVSGTSRAEPGGKYHRRFGPGWIPREHGAWAMLVLPVVVGAVIAGPTWRHVLLLAAWLVAYCAFHAAGLWLRSGRRPRYLPPLVFHACLAVVLGTALVVTAPYLVRWAPVYVVAAAISLICSVRRAERSWLNDTVTVLAASLMTLVAAGLGPGRQSLVVTPAVVWAAVILAVYFWGTVPYVKTLVRDRGDARVLAISILYHALFLAAALAVMARAVATRTALPESAALAALAAGLFLRSVLVPRRRPWPSPRSVGLGEIAASLATVIVAVTVGS